MKFKKLNSQYEVNVNTAKYKLDWEGKFVSKPQTQVKDFLFPFWRHDTVLGEFVIPGSRLRIDFLNLTAKVVIEVSPESSHSFNPFFHKSRAGGFLASVKRDGDKEVWARQNGFQFIIVGQKELDNLTKETFAELGLDL